MKEEEKQDRNVVGIACECARSAQHSFLLRPPPRGPHVHLPSQGDPAPAPVNFEEESDSDSGYGSNEERDGSYDDDCSECCQLFKFEGLHQKEF